MLQDHIISVAGAAGVGFSVVVAAAGVDLHHSAGIGCDDGRALIGGNIQSAVVSSVQKTAGEIICPGHGPQQVSLATFQLSGSGPGGRGGGKDFHAGNQAQ